MWVVGPGRCFVFSCVQSKRARAQGPRSFVLICYLLLLLFFFAAVFTATFLADFLTADFFAATFRAGAFTPAPRALCLAAALTPVVFFAATFFARFFAGL